MVLRWSLQAFPALAFLALVAPLASALPSSAAPGCVAMRLRGGSASASAQSASMAALKESAKRRAQMAKEAMAKEPKEKVGVVMGCVNGVLWLTNKIGVTGSTTKVVGGKIVTTRNPIQKLTAFIYAIFSGIFMFFQTLILGEASSGEGATEQQEGMEGGEGGDDEWMEKYKEDIAENAEWKNPDFLGKK